MRGALLKKRYGIPAALLMLLVSAGVATAFVVHNFTFSINPAEPLLFRQTNGLYIEYQGESDNIRVEMKNVSTEQGYGIFVDTDVESGQVDSITYPEPPTGLVSPERDNGADVNGDGDMWDAWYNIPPNDGIKVTVDPADNATPDNLEVNRDFERKAKY